MNYANTWKTLGKTSKTLGSRPATQNASLIKRSWIKTIGKTNENEGLGARETHKVKNVDKSRKKLKCDTNAKKVKCAEKWKRVKS